jgi:RAVE protein 1 C terminal
MNIWQVTIAIQQRVHCCTSHWARRNSFTGYGDKQHGIRSRRSCLTFYPMIFRRRDGAQQHLRTHTRCSASNGLVSSFFHIKRILNSKRAEYAAAFFLLGNSLKDAVSVCVKQLGDFQLAVALARVVEQSNEGPVLREILQNTVLPLAFKDGNRWLGSWAFWLLNRRDLAVRILLV